MIALLAAMAVGLGLALAVVSFLQRAKEQDDDLAAILQLPFGERDIPVEAVTESRAALLERSVPWPTEGGALQPMAGLRQLERARFAPAGEVVLARSPGGSSGRRHGGLTPAPPGVITGWPDRYWRGTL